MELLLYPTQTQFKAPEVIKTPISKQSVETWNPQAPIEQALNAIFSAQKEENKTTRTRRILGETARMLSDEQIECINAEFQFLIDSWLDEFEKNIFNGMTLKEILNEG